MTSSEHFRIAVLSDLHAFDEPDKGGSRPSFLCSLDPENPSTSPIAGALHLIKTQSLQADLVICPGDVTDKARPASLKWAWNRLQDLRGTLGAKALISTAGNHDLDSRYKFNPRSPRDFALTLTPSFPEMSELEWLRYWAVHFCILDVSPLCRLVLLNSPAYHGGALSQLDHGSIAEETLDRLKTALASSPARPLNILVCHHHPQKHGDLRLERYDSMENGQQLLDTLAATPGNRWLVVHGHMHHPKIAVAAGGNNAPIVFSAGSFAFNLADELGTGATNQFYLLEFPIAALNNGQLCGSICAWDWSFGNGWVPASKHSKLSARSGFGARKDAEALAGEIAAWLKVPFVSWQEVVAEIEEAQYLLPQDHARLRQALLTKYGLVLSYSEEGEPAQLGKQS